MNQLIRFLSSLVVLLNVLLLHAAEVHVAKTGSDSNLGTQAKPFLSVQKAISITQPGDRVLIGPGVYDEVVTSVGHGIAGKPIIIDGQGVASVTRMIINKSHHQILNLTVSGYTNLYSELLWLRRGGHSTMVSNVFFNAVSAKDVAGIAWEAPSSKPFGADAASNCLIISNRITGIMADTAVNVYGENNLISGNFVYDLGQADFVRLFGRGNIIRGNTFSNIFKVEGVGNHIDFIQTFGNLGFGSKGHVIEGNLVRDIEGGQLSQLETTMLPEIRDWTFRNNVFAEIALQGSCSVPEIKYYNNIFYRCNKSLGGSALIFGSRTYTNGVSRAHGARVINNVFLDCGDGSNTKGWYAFGTELTNVVADYNFVADANYQPKRVDTLSRAVGSLGGWDNFRWYEPNGLNGGNPEFSAISEYDFRLGKTSILRGMGTPLSEVLVDFLGAIRPHAPSIGAFEYTVVVPAPVPPRGFHILQ